jgi:hypothetical protein
VYLLILRASGVNSASLPSGVQFYPASGVFWGTLNTTGHYVLQVSAIDSANAQVSTNFILTAIEESSSTNIYNGMQPPASIVGAIVGSVGTAGLILVVIFGCWYWRRHEHRETSFSAEVLDNPENGSDNRQAASDPLTLEMAELASGRTNINSTTFDLPPSKQLSDCSSATFFALDYHADPPQPAFAQSTMSVGTQQPHQQHNNFALENNTDQSSVVEIKREKIQQQKIQEDLPERFYDSIFAVVMTDPVFTPQGRTYERSTLIGWIQAHGTDPMTREPLRVDQLIPNRNLREEYEEWLEQHQLK